MKQNMRSFFTVLIVLLYCTQRMNATNLTFKFSGTINSSNIPGVSVGDLFVATLSYDNTQFPYASISNFAAYNNFTYTVAVGGLTYSRQANDLMAVWNNDNAGRDQFVIGGTGTSFPSLNLSLVDATGAVFNSTALPTSLLIANFSGKNVRWYQTSTNLFTGNINSIISCTTPIITGTPSFCTGSNTTLTTASVNGASYCWRNSSADPAWMNVGSPKFSAGGAASVDLAFGGSTTYVAYQDIANGSKTTVMKFDGNNWINVGSPGFSAGIANDQSLAIAGSTPYVAYSDNANGLKTTVMKFDGTSWVNVGSPGFSAGLSFYQSLAFEGSTPYVAYQDIANGSKTTVKKFDGTNWVNVGSPGFSTGFSSNQELAFGGSTPYVVYRDISNGSETTVMKFDGTNWMNVGSAAFTGPANNQSLAIDGSTPYVAYQDNDDKASVMKFDGTNWVYVGAAGFSAGEILSMSIALLGSTPYVAFEDHANGDRTTVMKFDGTNWVNVGTAGFSAGSSVSQCLAFSGNTPYVASRDAFNESKVTVMKFDSSPCLGSTNSLVVNEADTYTVTVTNSDGCSATSAPVIVTMKPTPATPTITAGGPTTFCMGGSVTLTSSSATGNQWYKDGNSIGGAINQTLIATASGVYTVIVTTNECSSSPSAGTTVTVIPLPAITINAPTITQPTCLTGIGSIVVNATGSGTIEYSIDNGVNWQLSAGFSNLNPGNYNIRVRFQGGTCTLAYGSNPVVINVPSCPGKTIPGRVEAESFDIKNGPQYAVATGDPQGGGQHIVGIINGSWMDYNVYVVQNGLYNVTFRVATTQNNPQFQVKLGSTVLGTVSILNTGGWNTWQNITVNNIPLTAGARTIRIQSTTNETCNFNWTDWVVTGTNTAPTANAGPNQSIVQPTSQVALAGSASANNGGTITSHVWTKFSGPAGGNIADINNYNTTVTSLTVGTYIFRLTVSDNDGGSATSDVTIIVNPASGKFIPGRVEAESFDAKSGPQYAVPTSDAGGGQHVIGMNNGSWLDYNVNVTQKGAYTVTFRVATTQNSSQLQIKQGANTLATVNIPNSSGWDNWINVPVTGVQLTGTGTQTLRIQLSSNESCNFNWMDWQLTGAATAPSVNAGPNQVIILPTNQVTLAGSGSANNGGTIASHVWTKFSGGSANITDPNNYGSTVTGLVAGTYVFRLTVTQDDNQTATNDVTITVNPAPGGPGPSGKVIAGKIEAEAWDAKLGPQYSVPTTDAGGGQQVIGMSNGSWLDYNVTVTQTGTYTVNFRIATSQNNAQFQIKLGAAILGTINIPNTGSWGNWQTVAVNNIALTAGVKTIRIQSSNNESCNFNWMDWVLVVPPVAPVTMAVTKEPAETEVITSNKLSVSVFPNPALSYFNLRVQSKNMETITIKVFDIAGRAVQQLKGSPEQTIRFGDKMVNGTYFVEVRQGAEKVVLKVLKQ